MGWLVRGHLESRDHEGDQVIPALEKKVTGQGAKVIEEGSSGGEFGPQTLIGAVAQLEYRMAEKGQQDEHDDHRG
jgi:hypothetical protein